MLCRARDYEAAADGYQPAIRLDSRNPYHFTELAWTLPQHEQRHERMAAIKTALELSPDDPGVLHGAALALNHADLPSVAEPYLRRAIALNPQDVHYWTLLLRCLTDLERAPEALDLWPNVVRLAPSAPDVWLERAMALRGIGSNDDAEDALAEVLRLDPGHPGGLTLRITLLIKNGRTRHPNLPTMRPHRPGPWDSCPHPTLKVEWPREVIRTYFCATCADVMMCRCDQEWALTFRPWTVKQALGGPTPETGRVKLGFRPGVCATCRGQPEPACPGMSGSPVVRYYWREIHMEEVRRMGPETIPGRSGGPEHWARKVAVRKDVRAMFEELHQRAPKYEIPEAQPTRKKRRKK